MSTETKSLAAKITNGAWKAKRLRDNGGAPYATLYEAHIDLGVCMVWAPEGNEEQEANAELIAEAGTVTNETGMTPRELLAKLTKCAWELEKARQELVSCKHYLPPQSMEIVDDRITRIELFRSTLTLPADEHK